jgi:hypothetical protein
MQTRRVSIMECTNNKSSGVIYHVKPEGCVSGKYEQ